MATITVNVETPDGARVVGATIVIGNPITNAIGNGVRLESDNSGIADKTTDSNGQATWTVPDDYVSTWLVHILDSDGNRMTLPYRPPPVSTTGVSGMTTALSSPKVTMNTICIAVTTLRIQSRAV